jgi:hypothetical protein
VLGLDSHLTRHLELTADYNVTSAAFFNLSESILQNNVGLIDGAQTGQAPLHTADVGLQGNSGVFSATFSSHYVGPGNWLDRDGFWYADANITLTHGPVTLLLGVNNVFNSVAANYGYIGLGFYQPENQFGTDQNAYDQASKLFGLPYRAWRFIITFGPGSAL